MATNSIGLIIDVDYKGRPAFVQVQGDVDKVAQIMQTKGAQAAATLERGFGSALKSVLAFSAGIAGVNFGAGAILGGIRQMRDFQTEMANVDTQLTGLADGTLERLRQGILNLDPALGSSTQLARALFDALSAGVDASQAVKFVGDAARFAKAGLTDASVAVKVMTAAMDAYGMSAAQAGEISDALFTAVRIGKTTAEELANNIGAVFPVAQNLGLSFRETTATVTQLTRVFPSASEAVTGLRSALSNILQNAEKFKAAGIDIRNVIAKGGIVGAIDALREATGGSAEQIRDFIPDVQGLTAVLGLMGPQYKNLTETVKEFGHTSGATQEAFQKQQQTLDAATERFMNSLDRLVQGSAPQFLSAMTQIVDALRLSLPGALEFAGAMFRAAQGVFNTFVGVLLGGVSKIVGHLETLAGAAAKVAGWVGLDGVSAKLSSVRQSLGQTEQTLGELGQAGLQSGLDLLTGTDQAEAGQKKLQAAVQQATQAVQTQGKEAQKSADEAAQKVQALEDAYKTLGLKTPKALQLAATQAVAAFEQLKASGSASQEALAEAAEKTKGEIIAAYGKVPFEMQPLFFGIAKTGTDSASTIASAFDKARPEYGGVRRQGRGQDRADLRPHGGALQRARQDRKELPDEPENGRVHHPFAKDLGGLQEQLRDAVRAKSDIWRVGAGGEGLLRLCPPRVRPDHRRAPKPHRRPERARGRPERRRRAFYH